MFFIKHLTKVFKAFEDKTNNTKRIELFRKGQVIRKFKHLIQSWTWRSLFNLCITRILFGNIIIVTLKTKNRRDIQQSYTFNQVTNLYNYRSRHVHLKTWNLNDCCFVVISMKHWITWKICDRKIQLLSEKKSVCVHTQW